MNFLSSNSLSLTFLFIGFAACGVAALVGQILLGVAVYHNARAYCKTNAGMWCALTILFGYIPAVIYLATHKSEQNRLMICPQCQATHPVGFQTCPQCGIHNVYSDPFYSVYAQKEAVASKRFLIAAIVLHAVAVVGMIVCFVFLFAAVDSAVYTTHHYRYRTWY